MGALALAPAGPHVPSIPTNTHRSSIAISQFLYVKSPFEQKRTFLQQPPKPQTNGPPAVVNNNATSGQRQSLTRDAYEERKRKYLEQRQQYEYQLDNNKYTPRRYTQRSLYMLRQQQLQMNNANNNNNSNNNGDNYMALHYASSNNSNNGDATTTNSRFNEQMQANEANYNNTKYMSYTKWVAAEKRKARRQRRRLISTRYGYQPRVKHNVYYYGRQQHENDEEGEEAASSPPPQVSAGGAVNSHYNFVLGRTPPVSTAPPPMMDAYVPTVATTMTNTMNTTTNNTGRSFASTYASGTGTMNSTNPNYNNNNNNNNANRYGGYLYTNSNTGRGMLRVKKDSSELFAARIQGRHIELPHEKSPPPQQQLPPPPPSQ